MSDDTASSAFAAPVLRTAVEAPSRLLRPRIAWAVAVALLSSGALLSAGAHGRASRTLFAPTAALNGLRVVSVKDATEAVVVWRAEGIRGRQMIVLTGRWSRPQNPRGHPRTLGELEARRGARGLEPLDVMSALYLAAKSGIARRIDVVLPPAAFAARLAEVSGRKELVQERDGFQLPVDGFERRFSSPEGFRPPAEPVLVVIEPSWFAEGASPDPLSWLASRGVVWDLALLALEDPVADPAAVAAAAVHAATAGAVRAEIGE